ncbi:GDSL-type esterase/lipase family protein [Cumulibacter manganitolerans]|uniref:GDSL-type esterase/lipase family protein n=1 Tax=Cumulibacter manganitolerans TaxID=1884992 RepID=UPI001295452B|nr:GDSL-type esterase/lipase family protein [Cumulibacter manganitolerans]
MRPERIVVHGVGDSLTAAIADVWTNQRLVPWHEILVDLLPRTGVEVTLASRLARSGATSAEILAEQLAVADVADGDLVCLWVGGNDVLRAGYGISDSRAAIEGLFAAVRERGGVPLTMELPRISAVLPGPAWAMRAWDRQGALINELTAALSPAAGGVHLTWPGPRVTGPDGTHLSQAGHFEYAARYAAALAARWGVPAPVPDVPAGLPRFGPRDRRRWYVRHGWRWLARRRIDRRRRA